MLKDKKILLCVCGGIAIYKSVDLASRLKKEGAIVKTVMTQSAMEFITPLTFRAITHETVSYKLFNAEAPIEHISLADWADLIVIAPATANIIGKIANGIADDLLTTVVMAATCPKLIVPAMNVNMWENPIVQGNIKKLVGGGHIASPMELAEWGGVGGGYHILQPDSGTLACGSEGKGRMPEPEEIIYAIKSALYHHYDLKGKKILITAGASIERIDPMRHISNVSTGKMGLSLVRAAYLRGAEVTLVHSNLTEKLPYYSKNIQALSADEMYQAIMKIYINFDIIIMCAAVADFTPVHKSKQKIKKKDNMSLELTRTKDILSELGKLKKKTQLLIGFAAESENIIENAKEKLTKKNLDLIVGNSLSTAGTNDSEIYVITKKGKPLKYKGDKFYLANQILSLIPNQHSG
jgi:phosphopantothenoylcysteine decarboxylase/phosphopantothenate--cysteine ligase